MVWCSGQINVTLKSLKQKERSWVKVTGSANKCRRKHCILYMIHCTLYTVQCTVYSVHCTLYTVHCTMYTGYWILNTVHFSLYNVHCILYTVHCTLHTLYWIKLSSCRVNFLSLVKYYSHASFKYRSHSQIESALWVHKREFLTNLHKFTLDYIDHI